MEVTVTATKLKIDTDTYVARFDGRDIVKAEAYGGPQPGGSKTQNSWGVRLTLTGDAREAIEGGYFDISFAGGNVTNQPTWVNSKAGADKAVADISVMIRSSSGGGGGGQVDSIVPGDGIDVDATDPVNPIVSVKVDGVTIGFDGLGQLQVPAGGGGYVPVARTINTTYPLLGGGNLSTNRTFSVDKSTGGNGAADSGKVLVFGAEGQIQASSNLNNAVEGISASGTGIYGESGSGSQPAAEFVNPSGPIAHFHNITAQGAEVLNDGGINWTSGTGAQTTATNLPAFASGTKGVVPASGGGTTNFLRADGTWAAPPDTTGITQLTGDGTAGPGSGSQALTLATVNADVGTFGSATQSLTITANAKGLITAVSAQTVTPAVGSITGLGTGVSSALSNNADTASGFVTQTGGDARYVPLSVIWTSYSPGSPPSNNTTTAADIDSTANIAIPSTGLWEIVYSGNYTSAATTTGAGFGLRASGLTSNFVAVETMVDCSLNDRGTFQFFTLGNILASATSRSIYAGGNHFVIIAKINVTGTGTIIPTFVSEVAGSAITVNSLKGYAKLI